MNIDNTSNLNMERLRVIDLKEIAKSRGFRGYSKLRKAELIDLLTPKIIFIDEVAEREAEEKAEKRKRKAEKRRKKRESKKRKREAEVNSHKHNLRQCCLK